MGLRKRPARPTVKSSVSGYLRRLGGLKAKRRIARKQKRYPDVENLTKDISKLKKTMMENKGVMERAVAGRGQVKRQNRIKKREKRGPTRIV